MAGAPMEITRVLARVQKAKIMTNALPRVVFLYACGLLGGLLFLRPHHNLIIILGPLIVKPGGVCSAHDSDYRDEHVWRWLLTVLL